MSVFTVEERGVGRPDYTREISSGEIRPGYSLKYNQTLLAFVVSFSGVPSSFSWFKAALATGAMEHCVNGATGLDLPYTIPTGYILTMVSGGATLDQDVEIWLLLQIPPIPIAQRHLCFAKLAGGTPFYVPEVISFSSAPFDPTGSLSFGLDLQVTNLGGANMEGQVGVYMILEEVGTPPLPKTKTVKCKHCGHKQTVSIEVTQEVCPKCGGLTIYYSMAKYGGRG